VDSLKVSIEIEDETFVQTIKAISEVFKELLAEKASRE